MQFGRFHGLLIVVLGALLIAVQVWTSTAFHRLTSSAPTSQSPTNGNPPNPNTEKGSPLVQFLPGLLGVLCLIGGTMLIVKDRHRPTDIPVHPIH